MFSPITLFSSTFLALYALGVSAANDGKLFILTPDEVTQCHQTTITYGGGVPPYWISVYTGCADLQDDPVKEFQNATDTSIVWPDVTALGDVDLFYSIVDSKGAEAWSEDFTVKKSNALSCLDVAAVSSSSASLASVSATATGSSVVPTGTGSNANIKVAPNNAVVENNSGSATNKVAGSQTTDSTNAVTNGAQSIISRPLEMVAAVLVVALASSL